MKHTTKILFALSLASITALTACNGNNDKKDDPVVPDDPSDKADPIDPDNPDDIEPDVPEVIDPIYGDINYYEGALTANFPLSSEFNLSLLTTNISFSYQVATNIDQIDYYKACKFHLNLDLYSDKTSFESSILSQLIFPKLFSDFKYTEIINNVTDFDMYYLGDGMLYATLSTLGDDTTSEDTTRKVLNVTKMDVKAIINTIAENFDSYSNMDITSTLISIGSLLNGTRFDVEAITKIFTYSYFTILENGFNFELKEEGAKYLSNLLNGVICNLLNSTLGMALPSDTQILNISKVVLECTTTSFMINVTSNTSSKPLFGFNIQKAYDGKEIEPSINLEEKYYHDKEIINMVDDLYLGYYNFQLDEDYLKEYQKLIDKVTSLSDEDLSCVANFNEANGYSLLKENEDGTYSLSMYDTIVSNYESLKEKINALNDTDKSKLELFEVFEDFYYSHTSYSDYLKDNVLNKIKDEDPSKYEYFIDTMSTFFNSKVEDIVTTVSSKINAYNESSNPSLEDAYKILNDSYSLLYSDEIIVDGFGIWDSTDLDDSSVIEAFSDSAYNDYYNASIFNHYKDDEFSTLLNNFVLNYLDLLSIELDSIDETNLDLANYLVFGNTNKLDKIFKLADLVSSTSYESNVKTKYDSIINNLVSKVDKLINEKIDEIITEDKIYKLNHKEKVETVLESLNETYNYYFKLVKGNKLLNRYRSSFTWITKYNTLKGLLEEELSYYND